MVRFQYLVCCIIVYYDEKKIMIIEFQPRYGLPYGPNLFIFVPPVNFMMINLIKELTKIRAGSPKVRAARRPCGPATACCLAAGGRSGRIPAAVSRRGGHRPLLVLPDGAVLLAWRWLGSWDGGPALSNPGALARGPVRPSVGAGRHDGRLRFAARC